jgi:carboxypeptidase family protein
VRIHRIWALTLAFVLLATALFAQDASTPATAQITGTVTDVSGDTVAGATVSLEGSNLKAPIKLVSDDNGFFAFQQLASGTYRVTITAQEFATWTSSEFALNPGQYMIVTDCKLHVAQVNSTVNVVYRSDEVATEQVRVEETQRVFGIIPNFYVVYDPNPVPLTTKLKFRLAMKTSTDVYQPGGRYPELRSRLEGIWGARRRRFR